MKHICTIKPISKFFLPDFSGLHRENIEGYFEFGAEFWRYMFTTSQLKNFFDDQYYQYIQKKYQGLERQHLEQDFLFLLHKFDDTCKRIFSKYSLSPPNGEEVFFFYRMLAFFSQSYTEIFCQEGIEIDLREGILTYHPPAIFDNLEDFIAQFCNTQFYTEYFYPIFCQGIEKYEQFRAYKIHIFWPSEIFQAAIISQILKSRYPDAKIILDFSQANEQFDFTQWVETIEINQVYFSKYFDYCIVYRDFGKACALLDQYFDGKIQRENISNVLYFFDGKLHFLTGQIDVFDTLSRENFFEENFAPINTYTILGKVSVFGRLLPYKCYWNKCSFCTINTNNTFNFDPQYGYDFFVDTWIDFIQKNSIDSVTFKDEAIPPIALMLFAKKILATNLKITFQFRSRMEKAFTKEVCELLYLAGARYSGMGLESAIDRVNIELGNKGNEGVGLKEKVEILKNFDAAQIPVHNYSIMGFAGETPLEMSLTYSFLLSQIEKLQYFTCTPNIFSLMKGSKILQEKEKYGISVEEKYVKNPFLLSYPFSCNGTPQDTDTLQKYAEDIHREQFTPWLPKGYQGNVSLSQYWNFLDRSYIFYLMKKFHFPSPYRANFLKNIDQTSQLTFDLKQKKYHISPYIQFYEMSEKHYIYDWVGDREYYFATQESFLFLKFYNCNISLEENQIQHHVKDEDILFLLKNNVLQGFTNTFE